MKRKTRKMKQVEYAEKYGHIPIDYNKRLEWMYDNYNISSSKADRIIQKRDMMMGSLIYNDLIVELLEEPEGTPRPRFRLINRKNLANEAINNGAFVHVYSVNANEDRVFMQRLVDSELQQLDQLIYTPCIIEYNVCLKTPSSFNLEDKFLAEIGLIRPLVKPDWDNIGKKYSDMYNGNVWIDDSSVITGIVNRYYSILPRIEIKLRYLNMLYNKYQYNSISKKVDPLTNIQYFKV